MPARPVATHAVPRWPAPALYAAENDLPPERPASGTTRRAALHALRFRQADPPHRRHRVGQRSAPRSTAAPRGPRTPDAPQAERVHKTEQIGSGRGLLARARGQSTQKTRRAITAKPRDQHAASVGRQRRRHPVRHGGHRESRAAGSPAHPPRLVGDLERFGPTLSRCTRSTIPVSSPRGAQAAAKDRCERGVLGVAT